MKIVRFVAIRTDVLRNLTESNRHSSKEEGYNGGNKRIDLRIKRVGLNKTMERLRDGANKKLFVVAGDDK